MASLFLHMDTTKGSLLNNIATAERPWSPEAGALCEIGSGANYISEDAKSNDGERTHTPLQGTLTQTNYLLSQLRWLQGCLLSIALP